MRPVVFDSSFLVSAVEPEILPRDSGTGTKFRLLLRELDKRKTRIIIPAPVLAEVLVKRPTDRTRVIRLIQKSSRLELAPFGAAAAAVSAELMARRWLKIKERDAQWSRHRLKFDLQILAIAQVANAAVIYTTDRQLAGHCRGEGMPVLGFADLPAPTEVQSEMPLEQSPLAPTEGAASQKGAEPPLAAAAHSSGTE